MPFLSWVAYSFVPFMSWVAYCFVAFLSWEAYCFVPFFLSSLFFRAISVLSSLLSCAISVLSSLFFVPFFLSSLFFCAIFVLRNLLFCHYSFRIKSIKTLYSRFYAVSTSLEPTIIFNLSLIRVFLCFVNINYLNESQNTKQSLSIKTFIRATPEGFSSDESGWVIVSIRYRV